MDMKKYWFNSSTQTTQTIRLGRSYTRPHYLSLSQSYYDGIGTRPALWQMLWRKVVKKRDRKKKIFFSSAATEGIYDAETYSMNFDEGIGWMEPDNLPRSFSSRYADPSRILPPKHLSY